jgi:ParB family chromosome partitioning protein
MPTHPVATTLIPTSQIHANPDQPRKYFDPQAIAELKNSMAQRGLINPISVRQCDVGSGTYELIAGERRYRAAKELGWDQIDCRIWPAEATPQEVEMLSLVENLHRVDLNPIEVGNGYRALTEAPYNMTQEAIAKETGQNRVSVAQFIAVGGLPPEVQKIVIQITNLGLAHLLQICRLKTPKDQLKVAKMASEGDWTVKKLAGEVDGRLGSKGTSEQESKDAISSSPFKFIRKGSKVKFTGTFESAGGNLDAFLSDLRTAYLAWDHKASPAPLPSGSLARLFPGSPAPSVPVSSPAPRFPKTPAEEAELEAIAAGSPGPGPVYAWVFGPASEMSGVVQNMTWADLQVKDGQEGLPKILEALKKFWLKETQPGEPSDSRAEEIL